MNKRKYIIAVDFDNTLCDSKWPELGSPIFEVLEYVKMKKNSGCHVILWTCRKNEELDMAVNWCACHGLIFDGVNENAEESLNRFGGDSRKIYADEYIDDKNVDINHIKNIMANKQIEKYCADDTEALTECYIYNKKHKAINKLFVALDIVIIFCLIVVFVSIICEGFYM